MVETEKIYKLALRIFGLYFAVHLVLRCIALILIIGLLCLTNIQIELLRPLAMNTSDVISYLLLALLFLKRNRYVDKIYYNSLESEKGNEYTQLALISVKFTILFFVLKIFRNLLRILTILATRCIGRFGRGSDDLFFLQHDFLMLVYKDSIVPLTVLDLVRDISIDLTVVILLIVFVKKIKRFLVPEDLKSNRIVRETTMNNLTKQPSLREWLYIIIQNAILVGLPLIPLFYYYGDHLFSLDPAEQVSAYSSFWGGIILHHLTRMIFEATGAYDTVALFQLGFLALKFVIFNLLFFVVIKKQRFIYWSVFLNAALAIWALAVGCVLLMLHIPY